MKRLVQSVLCLGFVVLAAWTGGGCASPETTDNAASRPWSNPRGWESGLPSNINEGR